MHTLTTAANLQFWDIFPGEFKCPSYQIFEKNKMHNSSACSISILTLDSRFQVAGISRPKQLQSCQAVMWDEVWHTAVFHLHELRDLRLDHSAILIYIYFINVVVLEMSCDPDMQAEKICSKVFLKSYSAVNMFKWFWWYITVFLSVWGRLKPIQTGGRMDVCTTHLIRAADY